MEIDGAVSALNMMKSQFAKLFNQFEGSDKKNKVTNRQILSHAESLSERKN